MNALPTSLVRYEHELTRAIRHHRRRRRHSVGLRSVVSVAAVAAVALGVLSLVPSSGPSAVERASAALHASEGTILHTVLVGTLNAPDGPMELRIETWQASAPPHDQLQVTTARGRRFEVATSGGLDRLYDPRTNTIYTGSAPADPQSVPGARSAKWQSFGGKAGAAREEKTAGGDGYRAKILGLLDAGKIREDGRATVDGRAAIRLASDDGAVSMLVDAGTYEPIEWRVSEGGRTAVTRFPTYERLPATDANAALLDLGARHPDAAVDDDPAHYQAALERLNVKLR